VLLVCDAGVDVYAFARIADAALTASLVDATALSSHRGFPGRAQIGMISRVDLSIGNSQIVQVAHDRVAESHDVCDTEALVLERLFRPTRSPPD
jgi:hypothetical protein